MPPPPIAGRDVRRRRRIPGREQAADARVRVLVAALLYAAFVGLCAGAMIGAADPPLELAGSAPRPRASSIRSVASSPARSRTTRRARRSATRTPSFWRTGAARAAQPCGGGALENVFLPVFVAQLLVRRGRGAGHRARSCSCTVSTAKRRGLLQGPRGRGERGGAERTLVSRLVRRRAGLAVGVVVVVERRGLSAYWQNFSWIEGADAASPPLRYTTGVRVARFSSSRSTARRAARSKPRARRRCRLLGEAQLGVRHAFFSGRPA